MHACHPYPIFLSLAGRQCLVAGLGATGRRKLRGLLDAGATRVLALDIRPIDELCELAPAARGLLDDPRAAFRQGQCAKEDVAASFLVFACTASPAENRRIAALCAELDVLCNSATEPQTGSFILPAAAHAGSLCAAISTNGQSPRLAKIWRKELEAWLAPKERLAWLLGRLRPLVLSLEQPQAENAALFERIIASPIPVWLEQPENVDKCLEWLKKELPCGLSGQLAQIFSEYIHVFA